MNGIVTILLGIAVITALALGWVMACGYAYRAKPDQDAGESGEFTPARYEPMKRLLENEDIAFLASQPGYRPEIGSKLRRERRRIFRLYLDELAQDFHRLHAQARAMVADSGEQHSGLVGVLMRQQFTFLLAMSGIELRLLLDRAGLGKVDARRLVSAVEGMRLDLARFAGPQTSAA